MKTEILRMLRETDGYVSGQQISERFGVSRTAVWKVIRQLQEEGYQVEAVRNRGYHMAGSPDVMTKEELNSVLHTKWAGREIHYYDVTDSTNLRIRQAADDGAPHGTLAVADCQTAGRGRRGRSWESPAGSSIYMSILLRPEIAPIKASMLTLVMACSVAEGITRSLEKQPDRSRGAEIPSIQIKWPNDILIHKKKVCGILIEAITQDIQSNYVIGIGLNVNTTFFDETLKKKATSLFLELNKKISLHKVLSIYLKKWHKLFVSFKKNKDIILQEYKKYSCVLHQKIEFEYQGQFCNGIVLDILDDGSLLVQMNNKKITINYGEVSLKNFYEEGV